MYEFIGRSSQPDGCAWLFIVIPNDLSKIIRELFKWKEEGWGRMKAKIKIGNTEWKTSIWFDTKHDTYWFPVKAEIKKKENIEINKDIKVSLWL